MPATIAPAGQIIPNKRTDDGRFRKLKRSVITGVLIILFVIGWHFYENYLRAQHEKDHATTIEHEIHELTQKIFDDELKHNPYLIKLRLQGKTKSYNRDDRAKQPLLEVNDDLLKASESSSTVALMKRLFDNYELETNVAETVTEEEKEEEFAFLRAILNTKAMKRTMKFLVQKNMVSDDFETQLRLLHQIWFMQYSRGQGHVGSSGFEHVFMAELKNQQILGLHNWLYFHEQEQSGKLDYKGHIDHLDFGKDDQHLIALRFTFHDIVKPYNTIFVGTSPELEMSLYTVCFVVIPNELCPVQLGTTKFTITTHAWDWHGKKAIATAYPTIGRDIDT